jgi:hypothetical protein
MRTRRHGNDEQGGPKGLFANFSEIHFTNVVLDAYFATAKPFFVWKKVFFKA